ncbi:MAG: hypothetical protein AAFN27_04585 [Pseudomonadota bacterium]
MKLTDEQLSILDQFIRKEYDSDYVPDGALLKILEIVEIAVPLDFYHGPDLTQRPITRTIVTLVEIWDGYRLGRDYFLEDNSNAEFVSRENHNLSFDILQALRSGEIKAVRVLIDRSWACYHNCHGVFHQQLCEREFESTQNCQKSLLERCEP